MVRHWHAHLPDSADEHFNEGIDELTGKYYRLDEFVNYKADAEYPLPMIYQSGYLTIKHYDKRRNTFGLDFPNNEVKSGFLTMVANNYLQSRQDSCNTAQDLAFAWRTANSTSSAKC